MKLGPALSRFAVVTATLFFGFTGASSAAPESDFLDASFGTAGHVFPRSTTEKGVAALAEDTRGGVLIANDYFEVERRLQDGSIDPAFGDSNGVAHAFQSPWDEELEAMVVQKNGKIVLGGYGRVGLGPDRISMVLVRLNANGSPDRTFGEDGAVTSPARSLEDGAKVLRDLTVDDRGRILVVGHSSDRNGLLMRFTPTGKVDQSFGRDGKRIVRGRKARSMTALTSIDLTESGRIFVAGEKNGQSLIARYKSNGRPDRSFNRDGKTFGPSGPRSRCFSLDEFCSNSIVEAMPGGGALMSAQTPRPSSELGYSLFLKWKKHGDRDRDFQGDGFVRLTGTRVQSALGDSGRIKGGTATYGFESRPDGSVFVLQGINLKSGGPAMLGMLIDPASNEYLPAPSGEPYFLAAEGDHPYTGKVASTEYGQTLIGGWRSAPGYEGVQYDVRSAVYRVGLDG